MKVSVILLMLLPFFCLGQQDFYVAERYAQIDGSSGRHFTEILEWEYCLDTRINVNELEVWFESADLGMNFTCQRDYYSGRRAFDCEADEGIWTFAFFDGLMSLHREGDATTYIFKVE